MTNLDNMDNGQLLKLRDAIDQKIRNSAGGDLVEMRQKVDAMTATEGWDDVMVIANQTFTAQTLKIDIPVKVEAELYAFPGRAFGSLDHDIAMTHDNFDDVYGSVDTHDDVKSTLADLELSKDKLKEAIIAFAEKNELDKEEVWTCVTDNVD